MRKSLKESEWSWKWKLNVKQCEMVNNSAMIFLSRHFKVLKRGRKHFKIRIFALSMMTVFPSSTKFESKFAVTRHFFTVVVHLWQRIYLSCRLLRHLISDPT